MIKLKTILKEVSDREPSSISARSPLAVEILKTAFKAESPKTKYRIKNGDFEFDFNSFCENWQGVGLEHDRAWKEIFLPIAKTIIIIDGWASMDDVIFLNTLD